MTSEARPLVAIVMGSESDLPVMKGSTEVLNDFGIPFDIRVLSAHRTPHETAVLVRVNAMCS